MRFHKTYTRLQSVPVSICEQLSWPTRKMSREGSKTGYFFEKMLENHISLGLFQMKLQIFVLEKCTKYRKKKQTLGTANVCDA